MKHRKENEEKSALEESRPSMTSLIIWNISKALEKNPSIDLRLISVFVQCAMRSAHERLERQARDVGALIPQRPEERHVACAMLAWQQLGHQDADSLYEFIESHQNNRRRKTSEKLHNKENICTANSADVSTRPRGFIDHNPSLYSKGVDSASFDTPSLIGPVVKLPIDAKIVMRVENTSTCARHGAKKNKTQKNDITNKLDAACCLESACAEHLKELETATSELRTRAGKLARREAERVELLERAEVAWRDLELGYQRRLALAEEKEEDLAKQIKKVIEDRNSYKHACTALAQQLSQHGDAAENDRARLTTIEKEVCELACTRLRLSEESARGDAVVADQQCKAVQLDRDLQFKEEQARRKLVSMESMVDSARGLALEAERAMRSELGALKDQIAVVSNQLLDEDAESNRIKAELEELRQHKSDMLEDLEGCKLMCDNRMKGIVDELNKRREMLKEMKNKAIECQCKLPLDEAVEVKRTPSLAALCRCTAEEKILHSCSCTSIRSTLLSNLLGDLFGGLQAELGDTGALMPCQLLKCLEDRHNWDRASIVKSNLRSFFSQLLVGELDTAIATSIEKYHATWIGASCADKAKLTPESGELESEGWQERALERRAQKLASQLAEQLFQERADQLVQRAKDIVTAGPPPCECKPQNRATAYPCLIKSHTIGSTKRNETNSTYLKRTLHDFTLIKTQIEDLKKETIKKEDLRLMEENLAKIVKQASGPENTSIKISIPKITSTEESTMKQNTVICSENSENAKVRSEKVTVKNSSGIKKNQLSATFTRKSKRDTLDINRRLISMNKSNGKDLKKIGTSYAVNLCLCNRQKDPNITVQSSARSDDIKSWKEVSQDILSQIPSIKQSKPIAKIYSSKENRIIKDRKKLTHSPCPNNCTCFHKIPSNTSIDKLLETLLTWKEDLSNFPKRNSFIIPENMNNRTVQNRRDILKLKKSQFSHNNVILNVSTTQNIKMDENSKSGILNGIDTIEGVPPVTTSEYIGAINLDKSNENICKCVIDREKQISSQYCGDKINNSNLLFQCLNASKCDCKKSIQNVVDIPCCVENNEECNPTLAKMNTNLKSSCTIQNSYIENTIPEEITKNVNRVNNEKQHEQYYENKHVLRDKDFYIKFLGVTLTDVNSQKTGIANEKEIVNKDNSPYNKHGKKYLHKEPPITIERNSLASSRNKGKQRSNHFDDDQSGYGCDINHCQFVELRSDVKDDIKPITKHNAVSLAEKLQESKSCICCENDEEARNLEVNTFYLLEEHLKNKLAEFKKSSCKSTCILPSEEEKVYLTILDKVKQVISECAHNVKCQCSTENQNGGSWVRAYNLLQEYLKIKIKRAQCSCVPNKESLSNVVPSVLDKVCNLIETDFERLKSLCMCNNGERLNSDRKLTKISTLQILQNRDNKLINHNETEEMINAKSSYNQHLNRSCIIFENTSIQGSRNFGIEDKSCDAIQMITKDIQTSLKSLQFEPNEVIINQCFDVRNESKQETCTVPKNMEVRPYSHEKFNADQVNELKSVLSNSPHKLLHKKITNFKSEQSLTAPYIGFTLSCSCDNHLGSCVCSKSLSQSYVKNIDEISKMLEINKKLLPNLSYIMHNIPKRELDLVKSENINFVEVTDATYIHTILNQTQSVNASDDKEEITLKDSDATFNHNDNTTNTVDDLISVKTECLDEDEALFWYDCCHTPRTVNNDILRKKAFYDSVYSPIEELTNRATSDFAVKNNVRMCISKSKNCDCVMVPVCHVKKLVESIESKLLNDKCTCDSLCTQVCPLHSKTMNY